MDERFNIPARAVIGWREWVSLPELGIPAVKAKVDTGARTSALHAFRVEGFKRNGADWVRFSLHPLKRRNNLVLECTSLVLDRRVVRDSGGHPEERFVIETPIRLAGNEWPIEITLTNRETMLFRMLLGRTAMEKRLLIAPDASFLTGRTLSRAYAA